MGAGWGLASLNRCSSVPSAEQQAGWASLQLLEPQGVAPSWPCTPQARVQPGVIGQGGFSVCFLGLPCAGQHLFSIFIDELFCVLKFMILLKIQAILIECP